MDHFELCESCCIKHSHIREMPQSHKDPRLSTKPYLYVYIYV